MLLEATSELASRVTGAIRAAARTTGASFEYLLKTAQRESNFNPSAKARGSSASGLFQFIDQTWLETLKTAGPALGYARQASQIARTSSGRYVVPNAAARREIMQLRNDPTAASAMAGAFTQRNAAILTKRLGREPTDGELYIAHFLGPTGAGQLIAAAANNPNVKAAPLFPHAARANRSIFYARGNARSAQQVYAALVDTHNGTLVPPSAAPTMLAARTPSPSGLPMASGRGRDLAADAPPRGRAEAYARESGPIFHHLFGTERVTPVSSVVSELWTPKGTKPARDIEASAARVATAHADAVKPTAAPLRLFEFLRPELRNRSNGTG